jgi:hypothetical protein
MKKIALLILGLAIICGAGFYWYYYSLPKQISEPIVNLKIAVIQDLNILLKYPAEWGKVAVKNNPRVQTGQSKYLEFSIAKAEIPVFTFASPDFTAGRSGTTAELLTIKKETAIQSCLDLINTPTLASNVNDCHELKTLNNQKAFVFKTSKFESLSAEGLYFTGINNWPVLGIESSSGDLELIKQILLSINAL